MTVSIIIAAYNGEAYIANTLDSLLFQIRKPDEIVLVDDGSTDGTLAVMRRYAKQNPIIRVHSIPNGGSAAARIYGAAHSAGDALCFVDCDDTVDPDYVSSLLEALESGADVAVGGFAREYENGKLISCEMMQKRGDIAPYDEQALWINTALWNKMFRRDCIPDVTLPRIVQGDDLAYWCRILPNVERIAFVGKPMYHYIVRGGTQMSKFRRESFDLLLEELFACAKPLIGKPVFDTVFGAYFISLCVSQLSRYYLEDKREVKRLCRVLRSRFDAELPGWRSVQAFRFFAGWRGGVKGLAVYGCGALFKLGMFPLFTAAMSFLYKHGWKAKW